MILELVQTTKDLSVVLNNLLSAGFAAGVCPSRRCIVATKASTLYYFTFQDTATVRCSCNGYNFGGQELVKASVDVFMRDIRGACESSQSFAKFIEFPTECTCDVTFTDGSRDSVKASVSQEWLNKILSFPQQLIRSISMSIELADSVYAVYLLIGNKLMFIGYSEFKPSGGSIHISTEGIFVNQMPLLEEGEIGDLLNVINVVATVSYGNVRYDFRWIWADVELTSISDGNVVVLYPSSASMFLRIQPSPQFMPPPRGYSPNFSVQSGAQDLAITLWSLCRGREDMQGYCTVPMPAQAYVAVIKKLQEVPESRWRGITMLANLSYLNFNGRISFAYDGFYWISNPIKSDYGIFDIGGQLIRGTTYNVKYGPYPTVAFECKNPPCTYQMPVLYQGSSASFQSLLGGTKIVKAKVTFARYVIGGSALEFDAEIPVSVNLPDPTPKAKELASRAMGYNPPPGTSNAIYQLTSGGGGGGAGTGVVATASPTAGTQIPPAGGGGGGGPNVEPVADKIVDKPSIPKEGLRLEPGKSVTLKWRGANKYKWTFTVGNVYITGPISKQLTLNYLAGQTQQDIEEVSATLTIGPDAAQAYNTLKSLDFTIYMELTVEAWRTDKGKVGGDTFYVVI